MKTKLFLFDSLQNKNINFFHNFNRKKLSIYTCGPTVYRRAHIGNFRSYIFSSFLISVLKTFNLSTKWIVNITDIGDIDDLGVDKVLKTTQEERISVKEVVHKYTNAFIKDWKLLKIINPTDFINATKYISTYIKEINYLLSKKLAYFNEKGVYINTKKIINSKNIMFLLNKNISLNEKKEYIDFALWRFSKEENSIKTNLGQGIPGWHIECLIIIKKNLKYLDIHFGGKDHFFTHHNNEIIQNIAINNEMSLSKNWLHVAFVNYENSKMSKTNKNVITTDDILNKNIPIESLNLMMLLHKPFYKDITFSFQILNLYTKLIVKIIHKTIDLAFFKYNCFENLSNEKFLYFIQKHKNKEIWLDFYHKYLIFNLFHKETIHNLIKMIENSFSSFVTSLWILNFVFKLDIRNFISINFKKDNRLILLKIKELKNKRNFAEVDAFKKEIIEKEKAYFIDIKNESFIYKLN